MSDDQRIRDLRGKFDAVFESAEQDLYPRSKVETDTRNGRTVVKLIYSFKVADEGAGVVRARPSPDRFRAR